MPTKSINRIRIRLGRTSVCAIYKRLNAIAQPDAKIGHHDFVEYDPAQSALTALRKALKKGKVTINANRS